MCNEILCEPLTAMSIFVLSTRITNSTGISVNTTATFSCNQGFQINGSSSLLCQIDGTWNGTQPNCLEEVCQDPNTPLNSTLLSINRYLNGVAHFACNAGFQHTNGSLQRECLSSGDWSGVAPVCTFIRECMCPCGMVHVPKYTDINDKKLAQEIEQMQKELTVLKNQTSAALRKKISVKDFRPSANASGAVWVVVLMVIAGCIIVPDLIRALRHLLSCCRLGSKT
nr:E-selectin-like [Crassostrea gigas]